MKLCEMLNTVDYKPFGAADIEVKRPVADSRKVEPGDVFFALTGLGADGHNYIDAAIAAGASAIVTERPVEACGVCVCVTQSSRVALAVASANYYERPADKLKIIGVTGTNGKTTVTHIIRTILMLKGIKTGLIGTNHCLIGETELASGATTPEAPELHELFYKMAGEGVEYVVMEVSSHALDLERCFGITFEIGVFTNLTEDHLNYHASMDEYAKAKSKLFDMSKKSVINVDDSYGRMMHRTHPGSVTYAIDKKADAVAKDIQYSARGVIFELCYQNMSSQMRLAIPGKFSVYNALAAISACICLGMSEEDIQKGLVMVRGVKGRAEVVPTNTPYTVMIDYAHTPDGLENILNTIKGFAKGRIIAVFGCGGNRETEKRPKMGAIAARLADFCVVTSDNPRLEEPAAIVDDILAGMAGYEDKYTAIVDRKEAIAYAMSIAGTDDIVLLAGKGHETYQDIGGVKIDMDERVIIREILE